MFMQGFMPIVGSIGFLKCDAGRATEAFCNWQLGIQRPRGVELTSQAVQGPLANALLSLLPLTSVERRRFLFLPTRSEWTAFFDNGHQGTDAFSTISFLAHHLSCEGLRVTAIPHSPERDQYGATILEMYAPQEIDFINIRRSIAAVFDGARWEFEAAGQEQRFENAERYNKPRIRDRFNVEILSEYLMALGIDAFSEDFYLPDAGIGMRVEKSGPNAPSMREISMNPK